MGAEYETVLTFAAEFFSNQLVIIWSVFASDVMKFCCKNQKLR